MTSHNDRNEQGWAKEPQELDFFTHFFYFFFTSKCNLLVVASIILSLKAKIIARKAKPFFNTTCSISKSWELNITGNFCQVAFHIFNLKILRRFTQFENRILLYCNDIQATIILLSIDFKIQPKKFFPWQTWNSIMSKGH